MSRTRIVLASVGAMLIVAAGVYALASSQLWLAALCVALLGVAIVVLVRLLRSGSN